MFLNIRKEEIQQVCVVSLGWSVPEKKGEKNHTIGIKKN